MDRTRHTVDNSKLLLNTRDFFKSGERFAVVWDDQLELLRTDPLPEKDKLSTYYQSEDYISHTDNKRGFLPTLYRWVRAYTLRKKTRLINRMKPEKGRLLDIGTGTGAFLEVARKSGWDVCGVEPSDMAARSARNKGLDILERIDDLDTNSSFDVITLWHVLEHLPDLKEAVQKIKLLLKPGGVLIIAVPNHLSYDAKYYGPFWAGFDVPRHLWHFSKKSLPPIFKPELLSASVRPMIFDAFYVSLLSEKYKGKKGIMARAFFIGLWSNLKAMSSGEYSSLIYIFNKPKAPK